MSDLTTELAYNSNVKPGQWSRAWTSSNILPTYMLPSRSINQRITRHPVPLGQGSSMGGRGLVKWAKVRTINH